MTILQAIILGLIQGFTEFVPVSSSGHLVLAHHFFGVTQTGLSFDVALHVGTLMALLLYFNKELVIIAKSLFVKTPQTRLAWLLVVATIPAVIVGVLLESSAESAFRSPKLVAINLALVALLMLWAEQYYHSRVKKPTKLDKVTRKQAIIMGISQAAAIVPGVSRSGSTITAGLFTGMDRVAATRFSFLLGIPITAGAILKVFTDSAALQQLSDDKSVFVAGILAAFLSGLFAIRFMLRYLAGHSLSVFAYYRLGLSVVVLLALAFGA
ncbi:MAG: undecaprenyl-diphosphatase [Patescibacteria group bacterium]|nr:undecaprenyl-diphosphatase [Patescibacteria group bacterium]